MKQKKEKRKVLSARREAIISIQIYYNKENVPCLQITTNPQTEEQKKNNWTFSSYLFAKELVGCDNISFDELTNLISMFLRAKRLMEEKLSLI